MTVVLFRLMQIFLTTRLQNGMTVKRIFHLIYITTEKLLVEWPLGSAK